MRPQIYDTDTYEEIAKKIYNSDLFTSCTIVGFLQIEDKLVPKGEMVMKELESLYEAEYVYYVSGGKKKMRHWTYRPNSVGGPIAHKIFSFEKRIVDKEPRYMIWRVQ